MLKRTHKRLVNCQADNCTPRGTKSQQHEITADCEHPVTWCCGGRHLNPATMPKGAARTEHNVTVCGEERSARGCWASCSCGWLSQPETGKGANARATAEKWGHVDLVRSMR